MSESDPDPARRLPVVATPAREDPTRAHGSQVAGSGAFDAQLLGQGGARRGLRGGAPVLDEAQQTYLETEWSGPSDRRAPAGAARREKI